MPARQSADTLNVVDVLRQLPVDVLNRSFWPALNEKDLRSFREAGPAARNLIHQTKATVFIAAMSAGPYDLANVELRARLLQKYSACTDVSIAVETPGDVSCVLVRYPYGLSLVCCGHHHHHHEHAFMLLQLYECRYWHGCLNDTHPLHYKQFKFDTVSCP